MSPRHWSRLSIRVIWVDLALTVLSLVPALVALGLTAADLTGSTVWPLVGIAVVGVVGSVGDAVRWLFTRYRVTDTHIELRTGVVVRQHRSLRRERVRSVDIEARLRHRLARLRTVEVGAGQQAAAGESALTLDALSHADALALRRVLLGADSTPDTGESSPLHVFATLNPRWVIYNMFNMWAYLLAFGLIAGAWGVLSTVGVDPVAVAGGLFDWESLGWFGTVVAGVAAVTLLGWIGLTVNFFAEYWNFELTRVPGPDGTQLRTTQGLFTTREVNRADSRLRGVQLTEPLFWRWLGVTDTHVITTGLDVNSMSDPSSILPRVHRDDARRTAAAVLGEDASLFDVDLQRHPRRALARRLWWATVLSLAVTVVLAASAAAGVTGPEWMLGILAVWPAAIAGAVLAYRTLGHAVVGPYIIVRVGLFNRATYVLRRDAVSTVAVRESLLQRRLGLRTVSVMTSAGHGAYDIPDVDVRASAALAQSSAPGLLDGFTTGSPRPRPARSAPPRRIPAPDLARGVMLLLIAMAYATVYVGSGFGTVNSRQPWWDGAATVASVLFLDNRAFPVFAILFGYGIAWTVRRQRERDVDVLDTVFRLRRRAWALLAIGVVHAALVFPGEILMAYGLALLMTGWLLFRSRTTLTRAAVVTGAFSLVTVTAGMVAGAHGRHGGQPPPGVPGYATATDWAERVIGVPLSPVYLAVAYPLLLLVILGYIAGQARLLEMPERYRPVLGRLAVGGLTASVLGAVPAAMVTVGVLETGWVTEGVLMSLQVLTGVAGGVGYVALFALVGGNILGRRRGAAAVTAVGKRSLSFYLLNSVIVAVVLHPDLIGVRTGTLGALLVATAAWLVSLTAAVLLEQRGKPGPAEKLMATLIR
ncbi:PH domain-containing protein [Corynebacterium sp.]|jgi:putative membrane protein|uniref:PH domain-containing protein n=1 Tax=Corynebacterium sp. TaxID=1720 RepID=UPI0025BB79E5|nr:PH domain-containing protein [Corynebacterium sp.]